MQIGQLQSLVQAAVAKEQLETAYRVSAGKRSVSVVPIEDTSKQPERVIRVIPNKRDSLKATILTYSGENPLRVASRIIVDLISEGFNRVSAIRI